MIPKNKFGQYEQKCEWDWPRPLRALEAETFVPEAKYVKWHLIF